jgi:hypothetical protein
VELLDKVGFLEFPCDWQDIGPTVAFRVLTRGHLEIRAGDESVVIPLALIPLIDFYVRHARRELQEHQLRRLTNDVQICPGFYLARSAVDTDSTVFSISGRHYWLQGGAHFRHHNYWAKILTHLRRHCPKEFATALLAGRSLQQTGR